jgi:hypothetical protein
MVLKPSRKHAWVPLRASGAAAAGERTLDLGEEV